MFRVWGKIMKDNHLVKDTVVCIDDASLTRTKKVYKALEEMCYEFGQFYMDRFREEKSK